MKKKMTDPDSPGSPSTPLLSGPRLGPWGPEDSGSGRNLGQSILNVFNVFDYFRFLNIFNYYGGYVALGCENI